jgi:shikimate O-hydroxycinnamoyltransferase
MPDPTWNQKLRRDGHVLPLTPIDHVFTGPGSYAITFALAYGCLLDPASLQASLDEALDGFWPLCSRLVESSPHSYSFRCDEDAGLAIGLAESGDPLTESSDPASYIEPVASFPGEPLARIRLTQTPAGSVLGVSISHALVDGFSFFHFLSSWARLAQGSRILSPSPDRSALLPDTVNPEPGIDASQVLAQCGLFWGSGRSTAKNDPPSEEVVPISRRRLQAIKKEAQQGSEVSLTDNDVLTAYAWKEYGVKWASLQDGDKTYVTIPFDFRRLLRAVPRTYFGCALAFVTAEMDHDRLAAATLGEVASAVRKRVALVTGDYAIGSLRTLEGLRRERGLPAVQQLDVRHPTRGMVVTNISRLPIAGIDFGCGAPIGLRAAMLAERAVAIMPAEDGVVLRVLPPGSG